MVDQATPTSGQLGHLLHPDVVPDPGMELRELTPTPARMP